jgi:hypothetical protein
MQRVIRLWLDDIRDPVRHGCIGWTWAKTAAEAIEWLKTGRVVEASLDHDLTINQTLEMSDSQDTGYTVACWMQEHGVWPSDGIRCHSTNPVGRQRIEAVIRKANR